MNKNIYAWTAPGVNYPAFVSINETDKGVVMSIREEGRMHVLAIPLSDEELSRISVSIESYLAQAHGRDE